LLGVGRWDRRTLTDKPLLSVTEYHGVRIVGVAQAVQIIAAN
jgi:hypothetical protein